MAPSPQTPTNAVQDTRTGTDPMQIFPFDIKTLIFEDFSVTDLGRSQCVNQPWQASVREWIAARGLKKHFPCDWARVTDNGNADRKDPKYADVTAKEFTACAAEDARFESWTSARAASWAEYKPESHRHFCASERYYAWVDNGSIFWQQAGYQRAGAGQRMPHDIRKVPVPIHAAGVERLLVSPTGIVILTEKNLCGEIEVKAIDLHSGKKLWTGEGKSFSPAILKGRPGQSPQDGMTLGWETFCLFGAKATQLRVYDLRTGKWLRDHSLPAYSVQEGAVQAKIQIHKLAGKETIICWGEIIQNRNRMTQILFFDAATGSRTQDIRTQVQASSADIKLQFSTKRHDLTFAILSISRAVVMVKYFAPGADGKYEETTTDALSIGIDNLGSITSFDSLAVDPFRGFVAGTTSLANVLVLCRIKPSALTGNRALRTEAGLMLRLADSSDAGRRLSGSIEDVDGTRVGICPGLVAKGMVALRDRLVVRCEESDGRGEPVFVVFEFGFSGMGDDLTTEQGEYSQVFA
ncbi:uncharacterized protein DSM5745_00085 [Aspergillus mulundensis]|uniref:F-box domain-containing protein n=1 Tax=Aspergillus mulundensis TaxID=1810919 RepID=A0A3D8T2I3_9EURO|nr:hypothetical protein DSM5745_00085 [Aspergillus mulundensis]RDW92763.1 hypothetical protein DSM5745_00085 [Aspergillus mulundensis]